MRSALRYEWTRIRTIRSTWWITGCAVVLGVGISLLMAWSISYTFGRDGVGITDLDGLGPSVATQLAATGAAPSLVSYLLAIIGIFAWGHEYRHGMIRASLTALNSRADFWFAKYVVCAAWVAVTSLVTFTLSALIGQAFLHSYADILSGQTWEFVGRTTLYAVILACLGMAFTALTRSQAFALVMLFLWPLLVESVITGVFHLVPGLRDQAELTRFLPFRAGNRLVDALSAGDGIFGDPLNGLGGAVVFGGVALVLMVASYLLFQRRDA